MVPSSVSRISLSGTGGTLLAELPLRPLRPLHPLSPLPHERRRFKKLIRTTPSVPPSCNQPNLRLPSLPPLSLSARLLDLKGLPAAGDRRP